ncbi:hypothetical protein Ais01nite_72260 [Asanoa ishikariensis]|uniref:4-amino-4-deoxy-L-arabinose transferase n=1 Tax=Asanoa ishikariensis TaxID=137265 RepID=A0A1H3UQG1_9ACTN|nr:hypothetical protein [Asanoa ishikariensis]GIF69191.1 hypothetical protein Ais01nite_72260 [Asanoa ishikariensis]SDZ64466.1 hypothetical protein SAMN05421684_7760 [Asanoa ishikariensis]
MSGTPAPTVHPSVASGRRVPVHLLAAGLIAASLVWRASITSRGYLTFDDFPLLSRADAATIGPDFLLTLFNNHFMPAGQLLTWVVLRLTEFQYWPYATVMLVGQALVSVALYRLLLLMLPTSPLLLAPLSLFLFTPLTLEATSWWAVGVNVLPMQLAMVLAAGAFVRYQRGGGRRHLVTLAAAVVFGLVFFEKSLLIVAFVALFAIFVYSPGGPVRAVVGAARRWWPVWLVLTVVSLAFLALYLSRTTTSSLRQPSSVGEVATFVGQLVTHTVVPGLLGGPWSWLDGADGAPLTAPSLAARVAALVVFAALVAVTILLRRGLAVRAWLLLLSYLALDAALLGATRMGSIFSGVAGAVPRYVGEIAVVAAICLGVALCGLREAHEGEAREGEAPEPVRAAPRWLPAYGYAIPAVLVLFLASCFWSGKGYGDDWAVKAGRDYLNTARADLAAAAPGTVFMDQPVPEHIVGPLSAPYNLQSQFFSPLDHDPTFVTQARNLWAFDQSGHVRPAWVQGVHGTPGPEEGCGYRVTGGQATTLRLERGVGDYWYAVRVAYIADRDTTGTLRLGAGHEHQFDVHRGLNAVFLLLDGGGAEVHLSVADPAANLCTNEIDVGSVVPQPAG